jgi:hypothetical protein
MKNFHFSFALLIGSAMVLTSFIFPTFQTENVKGAWKRTAESGEEVLQFMDGYFTHSAYDKTNRQFFFTRGGTYTYSNGELKGTIEFNSRNPEEVGKTHIVKTSISGNMLTTDFNGRTIQWAQIDNGINAAHGVWQITGRVQGDNFVPMNPGPRKTLKVLTSTRFQWIAINPETKGFFGTGGGTYTFKDGKYTETIEFFSRDSSRVGAALQFDGKVDNGTKWTHKG